MNRSAQRPIRSCVGCGARAPQASLLRVQVAAAGGLVRVTGAAGPGRSAYLHAAAACWTRFAARQGPVRSLRRTVDRAARRALLGELQDEQQFANMKR